MLGSSWQAPKASIFATPKIYRRKRGGFIGESGSESLICWKGWLLGEQSQCLSLKSLGSGKTSPIAAPQHLGPARATALRFAPHRVMLAGRETAQLSRGRILACGSRLRARLSRMFVLTRSASEIRGIGEYYQ
jgi:hypothetical protein